MPYQLALACLRKFLANPGYNVDDSILIIVHVIEEEINGGEKIVWIV
jgi:hypothetical protein